jgi:hypothetical protein
MNTTITGQVICAGRLKDNNGDEFHGLMIETGKDQLTNKAIPFYHQSAIIPFSSSAESVHEWLQTGISANQYRRLLDLLKFEIEEKLNK